MNEESRRYDYLVIGGGHNGLIAANYLARSGASVLVLEQRPYLGGMAATQPHLASAPLHQLSKGAIDSVFIKTTPILKELALESHGLRLIPIDPGYGWIGEDGETLGIFRDATRTAADIARFSRQDAKAYLALQHAFSRLLDLQQSIAGKTAEAIGAVDLAKGALRLVGDRAARRQLARLASCSAYEAIAASFQSDPLRSLFAYWTAIACPADVEGSGLYLASLSMIHRVGCSRPAGSMGGMIAALARSLAHHGGAVRLSAEIDRVLVRDGHARGVRLIDGSEIHASAGVLASCAPQVTYGRLLSRAEQSDNSHARLPFLPANSANMCPFKVDMALRGPLTFSRAQQRRTRLDGVDVGATSWMSGSFDDHLDHSAALRRGTSGQRPPIWMTVLSHQDPSLAPEGQSVAYLYTSAPMQPEDHWRTQGAATAGALVATAARYLDGLDTELGRCVTTPADFERQYSTPRGCLYHVDMLPTRLARTRPAVGMSGSRSEVAGLYLAGSGSHPGGGVFGMPGKLGAQTALADQRRRNALPVPSDLRLRTTPTL